MGFASLYPSYVFRLFLNRSLGFDHPLVQASRAPRPDAKLRPHTGYADFSPPPWEPTEVGVPGGDLVTADVAEMVIEARLSSL